MKNVLCLAFHFPPQGGGGVQRIAKFVRYLPRHGWLPTVLTTRWKPDITSDPTLLQDIPDEVDVVRTRFIDLFAYVRHRWSVLAVPDRAICWFPFAVPAGLRLLRTQRFDRILVTGGPHSAFLVAWVLSRLSGVPYVVDMRDPWSFPSYRGPLPAWRLWLERRMERAMLAGSAAAVFVYPPELESAAWPDLAQKFRLIRNGFDAMDFEGVEPQTFDRFSIVHAGTFPHGYRSASTLLDPLAALLASRPDLRQRVQVIFVGPPPPGIDELGFGDVVQCVGYQPHRTSISYLLGADLLALIGGDTLSEVSGKVYEYLAARKPILALVHPEGNAARLLYSHPLATVVDRQDAAVAQQWLERFLDGEIEAAAPGDVSHYERSQQAAQLAQILDECGP